jgi:hypothetical protein
VNVIPPDRNVGNNPLVVADGELPMLAAHRGGGDFALLIQIPHEYKTDQN